MSAHPYSDASLPTILGLVHERLEGAVGDEQLSDWFGRFALERFDPERVEFSAPSGLARDRVLRKYGFHLESCVRDLIGAPECEVVVRVREMGAHEAGAYGTGAQDGEFGGAGLGAATESVGGPISAEEADGAAFRLVGREAYGPGGASGLGRPHGEPAGGEFAGTQSPARDPLDAGAGGPERRAHDEAAIKLGWHSFEPTSLSAGYTFEDFVVGPCNRLSHAAALAVGENPGRAYNPLFIHGNVGLGKTHLLQAACHQIRRKQPDARVLYISCEEFTNRFIQAIQDGCLDVFRGFHRSVDVLVIDDVQFLANKDRTQEEFFHTFNALFNTNRQIIISSDRSPSEIPTVEDRLVSRFRWGLVAELEVPCFETRVAIVKRKARARHVDLSDEVAYFIAERIDTNIRELEGAIVKVVGVASILQRPIDVDLAQEALRGVVVSRRNRKLTIADVVQAVTDHYAVTMRDLTGKSRTQAISVPRQVCMYLCRQHTDESLESIGRFFGNRDHTTVMYGVQKIQKRVKEDPSISELIEAFGRRLGGS